MALISIRALIAVPVLVATGASAAQKLGTINRDTFVCVSWAAWHEYTLASLSSRGAHASKACPRRLAAKTKVVVVEDDAGEGAAEIRYEGTDWFVDAQRLD